MSEAEAGVEVHGAPQGEPSFGSPPVAARPAAQREPDARGRLHELARKLTAARNRRLMLEYLRLRRAVAGAATE
jgi:hypothetical protein